MTINDSRLLDAQQEFSRVIALTYEAKEAAVAADEGHMPADNAMECAKAADEALEQFEVTISALRFVMRRGVVHYKTAHRTELATGREYRGGDAA